MKQLEDIYYDPSHEASYADVEKISKSTRGNIPRNQVIDWLKSQDAYNLHRPIRRKFARQHYSVCNIDDVWKIDLADMRFLKSYNDDFSCLLVVIDVLSKFVWVEPLQSKTASEVKEAFERILHRTGGRIPIYLQSDKGKEFSGKVFQKFLSDLEIQFRVTRDPSIKAAIAERFNRTLKERMWRYFTRRNTHRYIDLLQPMVHAYNNARHSSIRMAPSIVNLQSAAVACANIQRQFVREAIRKKYLNTVWMILYATVVLKTSLQKDMKLAGQRSCLLSKRLSPGEHMHLSYTN
ncbi:uncharacterized protein LOC117182634 [Belonocnema kinseyi]|uniref:uncharacterized protein LOC117182634 n=1 Tax=Belonocnema kinseyi TaxID=2817044 RepID=UPI00143CD277|nr:uncharacterized protein LOC117182634 [Belonocnema kinseyi]